MFVAIDSVTASGRQKSAIIIRVVRAGTTGLGKHNAIPQGCDLPACSGGGSGKDPVSRMDCGQLQCLTHVCSGDAGITLGDSLGEWRTPN